MPSTLVHVAVAGLVGTALLGRAFDRRAIAVVLLVATIPDLDAFAGLVLPGAHRALLHTSVLPALVGGLLWADGRRQASVLRRRYGPRGVRVAWVALAGFVCGGLLPDLFTNGVNLLYPLHDAFYTVNGEALLSSQRGFVQTFVEIAPAAPQPTTETIHYSTGVDPAPGAEPATVDRVFPLAASGFELLLVLLGAFTVAVRLWEVDA